MFWWQRQLQQFGVGFTDVRAGSLALDDGEEAPAAAANRSRLAAALGVDTGSLQFMHQVHSARAMVLGDSLSGEGPGSKASAAADAPSAVPGTDALVSPAGGVPLAVLAADCMPIVLAGTAEPGAMGELRSTAVVHAGRRGLLGGIIPEAVAKMRRLGPQEISAWIGPSICGNCYEVPEAMAAEAAELMPATRARSRWGSAAIDLRAGAVQQLADLEVEHNLIDGCTLEEDGLFSYRRQASAGRFAGVVWRTGAAA